MKHEVLCIILGLGIVLTAMPVRGNVIFEDGFELYDLGTYPDSGGWIMTATGASQTLQYIEDLYSFTGNQALRLEGSGGYASVSDHYVDVTQFSSLRGALYVHEMPSGSPDSHIAYVSFTNRDGWPIYYAGFVLTNNGNVLAFPGENTIGAFQLQTWHTFEIIGNFRDSLFTVIFDGNPLVVDQPVGFSGIPTDIRLVAGFGYSPNPVIRFDDIVVEDLCVHDGDVNGNGSVTADDAQIAFLITLGLYTPTLQEECSADCDGNGSITAGDAQTIFYEVLGLGNCMD